MRLTHRPINPPKPRLTPVPSAQLFRFPIHSPAFRIEFPEFLTARPASERRAFCGGALCAPSFRLEGRMAADAQLPASRRKARSVDSQLTVERVPFPLHSIPPVINTESKLQ